jgi:hypothetical protein
MNWYKRAQQIEQIRQVLIQRFNTDYTTALPDDYVLEMTPEGMWVVYRTSGPPLYQKVTQTVNDEPDPKNAVKLAILRLLMEYS